jgi:hypothetical protein
MSLQVFKGTLDRFEGKLGVIKLDDGTEALWPIKNLADEIMPGTRLKLSVATSPDEQAEKEDLAKTMLNEILNVSDDSTANKTGQPE